MKFFNLLNCFQRILSAAIFLSITVVPALAPASESTLTFPADVNTALHYLLDTIGSCDAPVFDSQKIEPLIAFCEATEQEEGVYTTDNSFGKPSSFYQFPVNVGLQEIVDYTLDPHIPSVFFWPSSLRLAEWTEVVGGDEQFNRFQAACGQLDKPFYMKGVEKVTITPDQHTGAYYTYSLNKLLILTPFRQGKMMISINKQQAPSTPGKRGWVLGEDDDWNYIYTQEKGLNLKAIGWAKTYMYDSFGVSIHYQPSLDNPMVKAYVFSWLDAGWARINMVKPNHIHDGLERVALAFKSVLENPNLPDAKSLAQVFTTSEDLSEDVLRKYAANYLSGLKSRIEPSTKIWKKVSKDFDQQALLNQMSRDELFAVVALDYLKQILGRDPVLETYPF